MVEKLRGRQATFVALLISGYSVLDAGKVIGVSERTARRWLTLPEVKQALAEAQGAVLAQASREATAALGQAIATLRKVMAADSASPSARTQAARAVLEHATRLYESAVLTERVTALENKIVGGKR